MKWQSGDLISDSCTQESTLLNPTLRCHYGGSSSYPLPVILRRTEFLRTALTVDIEGRFSALWPIHGHALVVWGHRTTPSHMCQSAFVTHLHSLSCCEVWPPDGPIPVCSSSEMSRKQLGANESYLETRWGPSQPTAQMGKMHLRYFLKLHLVLAALEQAGWSIDSGSRMPGLHPLPPSSVTLAKFTGTHCFSTEHAVTQFPHPCCGDNRIFP